MSSSQNGGTPALVHRLTVRPVLFGLSLLGSAAFVAVLMWAIDTYTTFSKQTRQSGIANAVQVLVHQRLTERHLPAVIDMARGGAGNRCWGRVPDTPVPSPKCMSCNLFVMLAWFGEPI